MTQTTESTEFDTFCLYCTGDFRTCGCDRPVINRMITITEIYALRELLVDLGCSLAVLDDEVHNSEDDGFGTLSYADTRTELGLCPAGEDHFATSCHIYECAST